MPTTTISCTQGVAKRPRQRERNDWTLVPLTLERQTTCLIESL